MTPSNDRIPIHYRTLVLMNWFNNKIMYKYNWHLMRDNSMMKMITIQNLLPDQHIISRRKFTLKIENHKLVYIHIYCLFVLFVVKKIMNNIVFLCNFAWKLLSYRVTGLCCALWIFRWCAVRRQWATRNNWFEPILKTLWHHYQYNKHSCDHNRWPAEISVYAITSNWGKVHDDKWQFHRINVF